MREIIRNKIVDSITASAPQFTLRDVRLPNIKGKVKAVIGIRRSGKSTYLWQVILEKLKQKARRENLLYFSFEDERLAGIKNTDLQLLVEEYYTLYPEMRDKNNVVFIFDEIQVVPGWETFARRVLDTEKIELFISGSSAKLLSREVATSMRGRAMEVPIHPFSFREYLRHLGREPEKEIKHLKKSERSRLEKDLNEYLLHGGFPETIGASRRDKYELLKGYIDTVLLRDVIERHQVTHPIALRWMVRQFLSNAAGLFSINKFYNDLRSQGIPIAKDTLHEYLSYLDDAFLIRTISLAGGSERRRMVNPRKVYPIDMGFINLFAFSDRANLGHALETSVMIELERRGGEIAYIRNSTGTEIDFLVRFPDGHFELIQVCADLDDPVAQKREIDSLLDGLSEHKYASAHLILLKPNLLLEVPKKIKLHQASNWLLNED